MTCPSQSLIMIQSNDNKMWQFHVLLFEPIKTAGGDPDMIYGIQYMHTCEYCTVNILQLGDNW